MICVLTGCVAHFQWSGNCYRGDMFALNRGMEEALSAVSFFDQLDTSQGQETYNMGLLFKFNRTIFNVEQTLPNFTLSDYAQEFITFNDYGVLILHPGSWRFHGESPVSR